MKKNMYTFLVLALLFVTNPILAQENYTVRTPGPFKLVEYGSRELIFEWIVPRNIGGDSYEGETAYLMSKWIADQYSFLYFYDWGISRADNDNLYGYCRIIYTGEDDCVLTITGLRGTPDTMVINVGG